MTTLARLAAGVLASGLAGLPAWAQPATPPPGTPAATQHATAIATASDTASAETAIATGPGTGNRTGSAATPALASATASRDAGAATASLRDALDRAWQRAVAAGEAEGQQRRAEAERAATRRPWAAPPSLALSHRDDRLHRRAGQRETEVGIALPLWLPGQQAAQAGAAEAASALAQAAGQAARLRLAGELREAAWQAAALRAEATQAEAQAELLRQLADDVDRRVQAGDLARADALAARAEALAAAAALAEARRQLQAAQARWTLLTGLGTLPELPEPPEAAATDNVRSGRAPAAPATADPATAAPARADRAMADRTTADRTTVDQAPADPAQADVPAADPTQHPEARLARLATELARKRLDLLRLARRDAPELSVGLRQDTPGRGEATQGSLVLGLRLPFGTDDRNRPLEAAALAELDTAQTHEQRLRERLASDLAEARDALRSAALQREAEAGRARLLRERARLIDRAFRAGESPLPDLLRALAAAAQADSALARQTAALGLARARHQQALGFLP